MICHWPVYIYALCEPVTGEVRYVGRTTNPDRRFDAHLKHAQTAPLRGWIRELNGMIPEVTILEKVPAGGDVDARERFHISRYPSERLLNQRGRGVVEITSVVQEATRRALRTRSQVELGMMLGMSQAAVGRWAHGKVSPAAIAAATLLLEIDAEEDAPNDAVTDDDAPSEAP